ncbi:MAG: D-erythronate dehydrogenase [Burkholderiaceae bacterium]
MHILITGGAGFLGVLTAKALLAKNEVSGQLIKKVTLVDRVPTADAIAQDARVAQVTGDLVDLLHAGKAVPPDADCVVHLAAAVSAECEADFDLGMRSNLDATRLLLEACRAGKRVPRFVFSSSVAVFGGKLPAVMEDDTLPQPQSSYGIQKFMGEQLVADYTRKGFVDGRSVRLMTVSVRPGRPNGAASGFLSGIIREPLAGTRAVCPVAPDTAIALGSPAGSVAGIIKAMEASAQEWGGRTAVNLPALTVTVGEMVAALERAAGKAATDLIDWQPDANVARIVGGWPARFNAQRALALGLYPEKSFDAIVAAYIHANPAAVKLAIAGQNLKQETT